MPPTRTSAAATAGRLRWRMRGAWLWPTFVALTLVDTALVRLQPLSGSNTGIVPAFLLAGFVNLLVVALLSPVAGYLLRRHDPSRPAAVARNQGGTWLLVGVTVVFALLGYLHRGAAERERGAFHAQSEATRGYVAHSGAAQYQRHIDAANTIVLATDLYRTCVPGDPGQLPLCLLVNTDQTPPGVRVDDSHVPNEQYAPP